MAGFLTTYLNNKVLDHLFGGPTFTPPATLYVGLCQGSATKAGNLFEPNGGGYARVAVTNNAASFPPANIGNKSNGAVIQFPAPTGDWGTIVSLFIADAPAGGNILAMADLATPRTVTAGGPAPKVAVGSLYFSHT